MVEEESGSEESVYGVRFESDGGAGVGNLRVQAGGGGDLILGNSVFRFCKLRHFNSNMDLATFSERVLWCHVEHY